MDSELIIRVLSEQVNELEKRQNAMVATLRSIKAGEFNLDRLVLIGDSGISILPDIAVLHNHRESEAS